LSCATREAGEDAATALGIAAGDLVVYVERLLRFNGETVVFDQIHLVTELFAGLTLESLSGGDRSLYSLFENDYGVRMIHAAEHLRAVAADPYSAGLLGVQPGVPLLLVERTAYTYGNKPVEWRRGLYRTDRQHYRNDLG
jgi:GntR family transcriptional regulator